MTTIFDQVHFRDDQSASNGQTRHYFDKIPFPMDLPFRRRPQEPRLADPEDPLSDPLKENPIIVLSHTIFKILLSLSPLWSLRRASHMPQGPSVVVTKTCGPEIYLFRDVATDGEQQSGKGPGLVLCGHENDGYGLNWSPLKQGFLLSGSYNNRICSWDVVAGMETDNSFLYTRDVFVAHKDAVEDCAWHVYNENLFSSVGDDHMLMIWDLRASDLAMPQDEDELKLPLTFHDSVCYEIVLPQH